MKCKATLAPFDYTTDRILWHEAFGRADKVIE
jgi:hypothetical protein